MNRADSSSPEEIATFDPDVIIAAWCGAGDRVPLEKIIRDRGWQSTTAAARSGRVFCIPRRIPEHACADAAAGARSRWRSRSIRNSFRARKESGRLLAFPLLLM